jgi:hypothetical protein
VSYGGEEKWERPSPTVPTRGIRSASPHGTMATGGVRLPLHHRAHCHMRAGDRREPLSGVCD